MIHTSTSNVVFDDKGDYIDETFDRLRDWCDGAARLVSVSKRPFSAISVSVCEISCAAYAEYASAEFLDFLDLAENFTF